MFKFSAVSQIWKKYIQKLNDWDLPLNKQSFGNFPILITILNADWIHKGIIYL